MRFRPYIANPCPVADRLSTLMDGDVCRHCDKRVFDLDAMSNAACNRLLAETSDDLCVRYRAPIPAALAAAALAAVLMPGTASAQVHETPAPSTEEQDAEAYEIIVGGARRLSYNERLQLRLEAYWDREREGRKQRKAKAREAAH